MSDVYKRIEEAIHNSKTNKKKEDSGNDVYSRIDSAFENVRLQRIQDGTYESPAKKANAWIQTVNSFRKGVGEIKSDTYNSQDVLNRYKSQVSDLETQRTDLINQLNKNKRLYGAEDTERAVKALSAINFDDVNSALNYYSDYFSQWENEDAFNYAKAQNDKKQLYASLTDEELEKEIEKNKEGNKWYDKVINKVAEIGSYIPTTDANTPISTINKQQQAQATVRGAVEQSKTDSLEKDTNIAMLQQEKNNRLLKEYETLPDDVKNLLKGYVNADRKTDETNIGNIGTSLANALTGQQGGSNAYNTQNATAKSEAEEYAQLLNAKGVEWTKYVEPLRIATDEGYYANSRKENQEFAKEHPFLASAVSVLESPVKALGTIEMLESAVDGSSDQLNYNSPYFTANRMSADIRSTVMENHDWVADENSDNYFKNKDWFDTFYSLAMSSGDTLLNVALGGGAPGAAATMLGVEAATDTAIETAENGGSKWDALVTGTIAGVNEALFEKISIGNLKSMASRSIGNYFSKEGVKTLVANLAKSTGINATEEMCTEAANIVTDYLINGGTSSFVENYNAGLAQGLSEAEAKKQAYTAMAVQIGEAGVSGALQGLLFGGVGSATAAGSQRAEERSVGKGYSNKEFMALREEAQKLGIDVSKYSYANDSQVGRLQTLIESKKTEQARQYLIKDAEKVGIDTSKYKTKTAEGLQQLRKAYDERQQQIYDEVKETQYFIYKKAIEKQFLSRGENKTKARDYAIFLVKWRFHGEKISENVLRELADNENARNINRELTDNAEWVQEADKQLDTAYADIERRYQITRDEQREAEIDEKIESVSSSESNAVETPVSEDSAEAVTDVTPLDENTVKSKIYNKLKNTVVYENSDGMYDTIFNEYYNAGLKGIGSFEAFDKIASWTHQFAPESFRRSVYESAKNTRFNDPGVHRMYQGELDSRQQAQVDILDILGKKFDISFIVADTFDGEGGNLNGFYLAGTNKVGIALDAEGDLYLRTAGHECYHYIETWNKKGAVELRDMVIDYLKESKDYNYKEQVEQYAKAYKLSVVDNINAIHSEMVADCMFDVFSNERFVNNLIKENKTLAQKVCDFIKELLSEIKNMIKNYHNSPEMEALKEMKVLLDDINLNFAYQFEIASENAKKAKTAELQSTAEKSEQKNNTTEDGVKYSLKNIDLENIQKKYEITNLKDYIQVQKKVIEKLTETGFLNQNGTKLITNKATGIDIVINKSGIKETFGKGKRYEFQSRENKILKLATVEFLDEVIENAVVYGKSENYHNKDSKVEYLYLKYNVMINGKLYTIAADVRMSPDKNKFWLHRIYDATKENQQSFGEAKNNTLNHPYLTIADKAIKSQNYSNVNENEEKSEKTDVENEKSVKSLKLSPDAKKVLEENPELKSAFLYLQSQFKLVKDYVPGEEQLMEYAKQLKKSNASTKDVYEIKNDLRNIYSILHSMTDSRGLEYATNTALKLATDIMATSKVLDEQNQAKQELRKQLNETMKNRKFRLTEEVKQEIIYHYGSWKDFVKNSRGVSMHLAKNAPYTLESCWSDLCGELPELLDSSTNEKDQVFALIEAYNATDVDYGLHDDYQYNNQLQYIVTEILETIEKIPNENTFRAAIEDRHAREMNDLREKTDKTIKTLKKKHQDDLINKSDYWREQIKKRAEQKRMTEMRNRIERQMIRLSGMLAKGTKNRHIPIQLIESVKELCEMFFLRDSLQKKLSENIGKIETNYKKLSQSDEFTFYNSFAPEVAELITQLKDTVGNKTVSSMTADELQQVDEVVRAIAQKVTRSNSLFIEGRQENASESAIRVMEELTHRKKEFALQNEKLNDFLNSATDTGERFGWKLLKPVYAFRLIGSETLIELEKNLRKGEDVWAVDLSEAQKKFTELSSQYNHNDWKNDKVNVRLFQGDVSFSVQQLMSLYCAFQRKQFVPHLLNGGFAFDKEYVSEKVPELDAQGNRKRDKNGKELKYKRYVRGGTVRLHEDDFKAISDALTSEQRAYADSMRDYLSFDLAEKGNSVTRRLYDTNRFTEEKYFPIKAAREFVRADYKDVGEKSILGMGMTKDLQEMADNPVLLRDFDTVWAEHVQQMATYHAFALRIDDFNKVFNYGTKNTAAKVGSVKSKLQEAWGAEAVNYIETFLKDVNGRLHIDDGGSFLTRGISQFKKASVLASASVVIQQPSAMVRAMAEVDGKYFLQKPSFKEYEEMQRYAPIAQIKAMGFFDTGIGPSTINWLLEPTYQKDEIIKGLLQDEDYRKKVYDKVLTFGPEIMDELTWVQIWKAVKKEQQSLNKNLQGEELHKKTAERFTEVIELTQVYDSVFSKSEIMRSKDTGAKMLTAFMAEPTVSLNMYVDAVLQGKSVSKKKAARIIFSVVGSAVLNALLKSIISAARDDDEKKTQLEKYVSAVITNSINDILPWNMIPVLRDISSIFNGYDVERSDMSVIADLAQVIESLTSDEKSTGAKFIDLAGAVSSFFGLPLKNVVRDIRAVINTHNRIWNIQDAFNFEWAAIGIGLERDAYSNIIYRTINGGEKKNSDYMYEAIKNQKWDRYDYLTKELGSPDAVHSAMVRGLKDNDSRVLEAAQYRLKGDSVSFGATVKEIVSDGFPEKQVISAVNSMYNQLTEETEEESPEKEKSIYNAVDLYNAVNSGTNYAEIIDDMIEVEIANGKTEEQAENTVRGRINSSWKKEFINASDSERETIRDMLDKTGLYEDVEETTNSWLLTVLKDRYKEASSYSERKEIENQIWALDYYESRASMKSALKKMMEDDSEEK